MLSSLVKLQHLNLAFCSKLTDSCLQYIAGQASYKLSWDQTADYVFQLCTSTPDLDIRWNVKPLDIVYNYNFLLPLPYKV